MERQRYRKKLLAYPKIKVDYCISVSIVDLLGETVWLIFCNLLKNLI